ncbi:MAG: hypothetical protein HRT61_00920 [Ekhidna sp.]|nr:hypothetical protein [Ekhidna sp.]
MDNLLTKEQQDLMSQILVSNTALENDYTELDRLAGMDLSLPWQFELRPHQLPGQDNFDPSVISLVLFFKNTDNGSEFTFKFYTAGLIGFGETNQSGIEVAYSKLDARKQSEIIDKLAELKALI